MDKVEHIALQMVAVRIADMAFAVMSTDSSIDLYPGQDSAFESISICFDQSGCGPVGEFWFSGVADFVMHKGIVFSETYLAELTAFRRITMPFGPEGKRRACLGEFRITTVAFDGFHYRISASMYGTMPVPGDRWRPIWPPSFPTQPHEWDSFLRLWEWG
jgi:hypothetical protein